MTRRPGGRHSQRNSHAEQREASLSAVARVSWAQILRFSQDIQMGMTGTQVVGDSHPSLFIFVVMLSSAMYPAEPWSGWVGLRSFVTLRMTRRGTELSIACPESNVEGLEP